METPREVRETAILIAARPGYYKPWPAQEAVALIELLREDWEWEDE